MIFQEVVLDMVQSRHLLNFIDLSSSDSASVSEVSQFTNIQILTLPSLVGLGRIVLSLERIVLLQSYSDKRQFVQL